MAAHGRLDGYSGPAACGLSEHYDVLEAIGRGSFGTVSRIRRKADGRVSGRRRTARRRVRASELRSRPVPNRAGAPMPTPAAQTLVCKELNYGVMREKEKELVSAGATTVNSERDWPHFVS